jgi:hypothetical protein
MDNGNTTRLGEGVAMGFSPDGRSILVATEDHKQLFVIPVAGGPGRPLPDIGVTYQWARFLPDGQHLVVLASRPSRGLQLYLRSLTESRLVPLGGEMMVRNAAVSPDGHQVAVLSGGQVVVYPTHPGPGRIVPTSEPLAPLRWSRQGPWLFVQHLGGFTELPARISQLNVSTGRRTPWRELMPPDRMGVTSVTGVAISPDEQSYVYSYRRILSELFLVEGWR